MTTRKNYRTHSNTYTQEEALNNIAQLQELMNTAKDKRTELTKEINGIKKQIEYWESLDQSQTKLF